MKVIVLMPMGEQRGGGELMLIDLLRYGADADVEWHVIFMEWGPLVDQVRTLGVTVEVVEAGRLRQVARYVQTVRALTRITRRERADLVLSWSGKPHLYGGFAAWFYNIPSAWYQLGFPVGRHLSWVDRVATVVPVHTVLTLSRIAQRGQEALWPSRSTALVYPSARLEEFDPDRLPPPSEARRQLGLPLEGHLIGIVGRLQRWKGIHTLIAAMPAILEGHELSHAVIVGGRHELEPDYEEYLDRQITGLGLEDKVIRTGFQTDVPLWMQAMDIVVHASDNEPFGIVIIEAMALGKPVVAGDRGGPREIISDGVNGLLAPYENAELLAKQVLRYLDDPGFARSMGERAQRRARDFSPKRYAREVIDVLRTIVAKD